MRTGPEILAMAGTMEVLAILLVFVVHVIGAGFLVWALADDEEGFEGMRGWWPRDDRPDDGGPLEPEPAP
jgi:hypothetical protein